MKKLEKSEYRSVLPDIDRQAGGAIYACSIAEGIQSGEIYTDGDAVLFWHFCGFALLHGQYDNGTLERIYKNFLAEGVRLPRRFLLFLPAEKAELFAGRAGILTEQRYFYEYGGNDAPEPVLPEGFAVQAMHADLIARMPGRIVPGFSWDSTAQFLQNGMGYCVTAQDAPAAWAFSAAVSSTEMDIGVETSENYRQRGLAYAAARHMAAYILAQGKKPVWACHAGNLGSRRLAEKTGFVKTSECCTVRSCST